jgi:hypothetical protein
MYLDYKTSKYKNTIYKSYSIAESYREGNKVRKRIIWPIGRLTDKQADQIRLICRTVSDPNMIITTIDNMVAQESKRFLDLAVANALWEQWRLSAAFGNNTTNSELSTPIIARILTINRCVCPCSHYSIPQWAWESALSEVIGDHLKNLNDDKIYYELNKIDENQQRIENHLFKMTYKNDKASYDFVKYQYRSA